VTQASAFRRRGGSPVLPSPPRRRSPGIGPRIRPDPPATDPVGRGVQLKYLLARHRGFPLANRLGCTPRSTACNAGRASL